MNSTTTAKVIQPAGIADAESLATAVLDSWAGFGAGTETFFFDIFLLRYRK
jgi:hypothetical protein